MSHTMHLAVAIMATLPVTSRRGRVHFEVTCSALLVQLGTTRCSFACPSWYNTVQIYCTNFNTHYLDLPQQHTWAQAVSRGFLKGSFTKQVVQRGGGGGCIEITTGDQEAGSTGFTLDGTSDGQSLSPPTPRTIEYFGNFQLKLHCMHLSWPQTNFPLSEIKRMDKISKCRFYNPFSVIFNSFPTELELKNGEK